MPRIAIRKTVVAGLRRTRNKETTAIFQYSEIEKNNFAQHDKIQKAGDTKEGIPTEASLALNPVRLVDFEAKVGTLSWQDPLFTINIINNTKSVSARR